MKIKKIIITILAVIVVLLIIFLPKIDFKSGSKKDGNIRTFILSVDGKLMKLEPLQNKIFTNGSLTSNEEVQLRSETSGKVTSISFEEGRRVKKGDLLLKINDAELQATLKKNLIEIFY